MSGNAVLNARKASESIIVVPDRPPRGPIRNASARRSQENRISGSVGIRSAGGGIAPVSILNQSEELFRSARSRAEQRAARLRVSFPSRSLLKLLAVLFRIY